MSQTLTFRIGRRFAAPVDRLFRAWTSPAELACWWCPPGWVPAGLQIDLRIGGKFRFGMERTGTADVVYSHGRFIDVCAPRRLVYTWNWENAFPEMPETLVTVEFTAREGGTELTLIHEALPGIPLCLRHRSGWLDAFERLRRVAESVQTSRL
jgi:uncharacterized protein YndB with AHSA1/START domain